MSDNFEMLVDVDATPSEAEAVAQAVIQRFRELGLITGDANEECVLGGTGYLPGPAVADSYELEEHESRFWELAACGVEPMIGRSFNVWALGESCEVITCPDCSADIDPHNGGFLGAVAEAAQEWLSEAGPALVSCPECGKERPITEWQCTPPFGFGNLSFRFWNWPALDSPAWKIDIATIVQAVTGHRIVKTDGHI